MRSTQTEPSFIPYDWFDNQPKEGSKDFNQVMAWLAARGVPAPAVSFLPIAYTGTLTRPLPPVMCLRFSGYDGVVDGALALNAPGVVLQALGITPISGGFNYAPPAATATPKPTPTDMSGIGAFNYIDEFGKAHYFDNPDYESSIGATLTGPKGEKLKQFIKPGPFGSWIDWVEV